jgi:hypothetical protein
MHLKAVVEHLNICRRGNALVGTLPWSVYISFLA